MSDALVSPAVAGIMYVCSAAVAGFSIRNTRTGDTGRKIPLMGMMGAFVFAAQMINFTIPGTGSSGHLCGGMLLSALLGPSAGFLTMTAILLVQCLLFADGGLMALGCNIWNMGFYGCFVGGFLIWRAFTGNKLTRGRIISASVCGSIVSLLLGAFSVCLETLASGITELPFAVFVSFMMPIHLVIGLVEGLITAAVLVFVFRARPELLYDAQGAGHSAVISEQGADAPVQGADAPVQGADAPVQGAGRLKVSAVLGIFAAVTLVVGGLLSHLASSNPDGLEWSIQKVTGSEELSTDQSVALWAADVQEHTALLPDYSFRESGHGTSFSGVAGALVVLALCFIIGMVFRKPRAVASPADHLTGPTVAQPAAPQSGPAPAASNDQPAAAATDQPAAASNPQPVKDQEMKDGKD